MKQLRVLVADDSIGFLASAADFLSREPRVEVVGVARDGRDAVWLADELSPDLVLMDLTMPIMDGLTATRHIKSGRHAPRVVIVSFHERAECRRAADQAGADGYICKSHFTEGVLAEVDAFFSEPAGSPPIGTS